jgi:hypothetical protein
MHRAVALLLLWAVPAAATSVEEVATAMRRAADFAHRSLAIEGGYHARYSTDLSSARSEHARGPTQVSVQREGTPGVGLALLDAWESSGDRAFLEYARAAAGALIQGQLCSGGWNKVIEFDPALRGELGYRVETDCLAVAPRTETSLDDNVSQGALRLLMRADRAFNFADDQLHEAALAGLDGLLLAQYPNGAWPQRFVALPDMSGHLELHASAPKNWPRNWPGDDYGSLYTLNDNTLTDLIDLYLEASRVYADPRYKEAALRGGEFLLRAQLPEPQRAWAQQYNRAMQPAWARHFEPPAVSGGESQGVLRILLTLYRETGEVRFLEPIPAALAYLRASLLPERDDDPPRKRRLCSTGTPCLSRFYELRSNRPLYITDGAFAADTSPDNRVSEGFELTYIAEKAMPRYSFWVRADTLELIAERRIALLSIRKQSLPRPVVLTGLSPWQAEGRPITVVKPEQAARIIASLDSRGAWVDAGSIVMSELQQNLSRLSSFLRARRGE